jgi:mono/diheme cytochrome c family protein
LQNIEGGTVSFRLVAVAAVLAFAACAFGAGDAPVPTAPPDALAAFSVVQPEPEPAATQDELAVGGFLFANMCAKCHGGAGQGTRRIAINRNDYGGIKEIITRGTIVYGGNMPAWTGILSADQIDDVTKYILASQRG